MNSTDQSLLRAASQRLDRDTLAVCTVYARGEPYPTCAGALYWSGVGRIVFGPTLEDEARRVFEEMPSQ